MSVHRMRVVVGWCSLRALPPAVPGALLVALAASLVACGGASASHVDEGATVVATTAIWADVVENVACGRIRVESLVPAGIDSHDYEPSVRDADRLAGADLIFTNGLGLETGMSDTIEAAVADRVTLVELGPALEPLRSRSGVDPHVWMDPDRVALAVPLISQALKGIPDSGLSPREVDDCADDYTARLSQLSAEMDEVLDPLGPADRQLVTEHAALGYLADRFGLVIVGSVIDSTSSLAQSDPRHLEDLAGQMRALGVDRLVIEQGEPSETAAALGEMVGHPLEIVGLHTETLGRPGSGAETYLGMMRTNARRIAGM